MVLQEFAQVNQERQQLEAQMDAVILREIDLNKRKHALQKSHDALTTELAAEKLQHGDTKEQLSVVQQDNSQYVDELKVRLLIYVSQQFFDSHVNLHAANLRCVAYQTWWSAATQLMMQVQPLSMH